MAADRAASTPVDKPGSPMCEGCVWPGNCGCFDIEGRYVCPLCGKQAMPSAHGPCRACGADVDDVEAQEPRWWEDKP